MMEIILDFPEVDLHRTFCGCDKFEEGCIAKVDYGEEVLAVVLRALDKPLTCGQVGSIMKG